jgi:hypothetical protein
MYAEHLAISAVCLAKGDLLLAMCFANLTQWLERTAGSGNKKSGFFE